MVYNTSTLNETKEVIKMKCIKVGKSITSLENVLDVHSSGGYITVRYKDGFVHPTAHAFCHHSATISSNEPEKVLAEIYKILRHSGA